VQIRGEGVVLDIERLMASPEAVAFFEELKAGRAEPTLATAQWTLLTHRPLPGVEDRHVPVYTVHMAVDGLGIMPGEYLGHDSDQVPEFDLRDLFEKVTRRAQKATWRARVDATYQLTGGSLYDLSLRLPDGIPGGWVGSIDPPATTQGPVSTVEELRRLARQRRRVVLSGSFDRASDIADGDVTGRLGAIISGLVDSPYEIEASWPVAINLTRYEWED